MDKKNAFDKTPQGRWDSVEEKYNTILPFNRTYSSVGWKGHRKATAKKYKPKRSKKK